MNKKIIFGAVGAVSLIGGIAVGLVHRSNERYRRVLSELERAADVLKDTTLVLEDVIDYLENTEVFIDDPDNEEDDEYDD